MDPDQALRDLVAAFMECDRMRAADLYEALDEWIGKHGFTPCLTRGIDPLTWLRELEELNNGVY